MLKKEEILFGTPFLLSDEGGEHGIAKQDLESTEAQIKEIKMSKLREIRRRKGLSQADLSLLTRIGIPQISLMENSHLKPFPSWRKRLAAVLEISEKELFGIGDDNGDNT